MAQKVWSQVPRSSKCVSEGELETRRGAHASVKVAKKKRGSSKVPVLRGILGRATWVGSSQ